MVTGVTASILGAFLLPLTGFIFGLATVFLVLLFTQTMDSQMSNQTVVLVGMIMTCLLYTSLYEAPDMQMGEITITEAYVNEKLNDIVQNEDLSRYIL